MMIYQLTRGQRFKVAGCELVFTFHKMDGRYCYATTDDGRHIHWSGPVTVVEDGV